MKNRVIEAEPDWIILRLLMAATKHEPHNPDAARAILHLTGKHGIRVVLDCIEELHRENEAKRGELCTSK